jgi:hypothetical protein
MKRLFKSLFIFIFILIIIVVVPLVILYFTVSDATDDAPTSLYDESVTFEGEINKLLERFSENKDNNFYLTFTEDNLDLLVFALIRNTINPNYYDGECTTDECKYIETVEVPADMFLIGGKKVLIKHAYTELKDNNVNLYLTLDAFGLKTNLNMGIEFTKNAGDYIFTFTKLGLGHLNLMSGIGKAIGKPILSLIGFDEAGINQRIEEQDLPLTFDLDDFAFTLKKEDLGELILKLIGNEGQSSALLTEFVKILTSSENELLDFGLFEVDQLNQFGFKVNLNEIKTSDAESDALAVEIADAAQGFDTNAFITNKTQTFIISGLASGSEKKLTFVNSDFNRLIYENTNGYQGFQFPETVAAGETPNFKVTGILLNFQPTELTFKFVIEINGIESVIQIKGDISGTPSEDELNIVLQDQMSIGGISASSKFLHDFIGDNLTNIQGMTYDKDTHTFTLSVDTFQNLMNVGGPSTPLTVEKIRAISGGIEIVVGFTDSELANTIQAATDAINSLLGSDFLDESGFDTTDPEQQQAIEALQEALDNIAEALTDPEQEISIEDTDELIEIINSLSPENQQELLDQIANGAASEDLEDLYELLFGN